MFWVQKKLKMVLYLLFESFVWIPPAFPSSHNIFEEKKSFLEMKGIVFDMKATPSIIFQVI